MADKEEPIGNRLHVPKVGAMQTHLMLLHEAFAENLSLDHKQVLSIERSWEWPHDEKTAEIASQVLYMNQGVTKGRALPATPYRGRNYGRDVLYGKAYLSAENKKMVNTLVDLLKTDQVMRSQLSPAQQRARLDQKCTV